MNSYSEALKLRHPFTCLVSGPTGCGKTQFVAMLLKFQMISPMPQRIRWIYGEDQPLYDELRKLIPEIEFIHNMPAGLYESIDPSETNLVILDDQMSKIGNSPILSRLFTEGSHHRNLSVIYIVQNLFDKGSSHRTVSTNSQYVVVFKNPRDAGQIRSFGSQMFEKGLASFLPQAYADATKEPYGYLLLDFKADTPDQYRMRTKMMPDEECIVYLPNEDYKRK